MHGGSSTTTPECRGSDPSFLTTLAWCINSTCTSVETWKLEKYWAEKTTGEVVLKPKWGYWETVERIEEKPTRLLPGEDEDLNFTAVIPHDSWARQKLTLETFERVETLHSRYG